MAYLRAAIRGAAWIKTDTAHLTSDTKVLAIGDVEGGAVEGVHQPE